MKNLFAVYFGLSCLLGATAARAGSKSSQQVIVDTSARFAVGSLGTARNSADPFQLFTCETIASATGASGFCVARNAAGAVGSCSTTAPAMIQAIDSINGDSIVQISWDASGACFGLVVVESSGSEPKQ